MTFKENAQIIYRSKYSRFRFDLAMEYYGLEKSFYIYLNSGVCWLKSFKRQKKGKKARPIRSVRRLKKNFFMSEYCCDVVLVGTVFDCEAFPEIVEKK